MKNKSIIIILLFIAGLHCLGIYLFFFKNSEGSKNTDGPDKEELSSEASDGDKTSKPLDKKELAKAAAAKRIAKLKLRRETDNPRFGEAFNYTKAVRGNIKALPGSKNAKTGILVDLGNREVLWAKNPRQKALIASMTKMMTALLAMEMIESDDQIDLDTSVKVTVNAYKIGGSQVWLDPRESFPIRELLKSVAIKSANDSAELIAEFLGDGDRNVFVDGMNRRAKELKLQNTHFFNPHGLPGGKKAGKDNYSSSEGMAMLAEVLLEYPLIMKWAATWSMKFREKAKKPMILTNHNRLVRDCPGVDGMKTGFTNRAGFCTTVTCRRGGRRLVAVVTGFPGRKGRDKFVRKLLDWGYKRKPKIYDSSFDSDETIPK